MKSRPARDKIELRFYRSSRDSGEKCSGSPFPCSRMSTLVANWWLTCVVAIPESKLLKMRGRKLRVRCLHFVLALAELGLAPKVLIKSRDLALLPDYTIFLFRYNFMSPLIRVKFYLLLVRSTLLMLRFYRETNKEQMLGFAFPLLARVSMLSTNAVFKLCVCLFK